jgi:uncharacterized repeat protein (TIGR01451 family)
MTFLDRLAMRSRPAKLLAGAAALAVVLGLALATHGQPASGATPLADPADLALTKSASPNPVTAGSVLTYTIRVSNNGPDPATNAVVSDDLPAEVQANSATASSGSCKVTGKHVECNLGTVDTVVVPTVTIKVTVKPNTKPGTISNTASVSSDVSDPQPANNSATATTTVIAAPTAPSCGGQPATVLGTPGNDVLNGTNKGDVIVALGGDDQVFAGAGNDLICARAGNDKVVGGSGNDTTLGGGGADRLLGRSGDDVLRGQRGRDTLRGARGNDLLAGGRGIDSCRGGPGRDLLRSCERH